MESFHCAGCCVRCARAAEWNWIIPAVAKEKIYPEFAESKTQGQPLLEQEFGAARLVPEGPLELGGVRPLRRRALIIGTYPGYQFGWPSLAEQRYLWWVQRDKPARCFVLKVAQDRTANAH